MQCPNCGATVREGAKLCVYCGAKLSGGQADRDGGAREGRAQRGGSLRSYAQPQRADADGYGDESVESPAYAPRAARAARDDDATYRRSGRAPDRPAYGGFDDGQDAASDYIPADRSPTRRGTGGTQSRGHDERYNDPLEDPRAPRGLRGPASYGAAQDDYDNRHDRRNGSSARGRQPAGYERSGGRASGDYERGRAGRDDPYRDGAQGNGHDDRHNSASARGAHSRRDEGRGYATPSAARDARPANPLEDSWGMPAFGSGESAWADESAAWGVAPSAQYPAAPAGRSRRPARSGKSASRSSRPGGRSASRSKSRAPLVLLLVLLAALIAGGGLFLTMKGQKAAPGTTTAPSPPFIAYTPGPTPTPAPNYTLFTSDTSAYILTYPKDWTLTKKASGAGPSSDYTETFAPKAGLPFLTVERAAGFDVLPNTGIVDAEVNGGKAAGETFAEIGAAVAIQVGGEQWTRREFDVTAKDGSKLHMAILGGHHAGHGYAIVFAAGPSDFAGLNTTALQTVLASFRFVG